MSFQPQKCPRSWSSEGFFPGVGNEGSEGRKFLSGVQWQSSNGDLGRATLPEEAEGSFSSTLTTFAAQKHFTTFPGGIICPLLPMPAGAHVYDAALA